MEEQNHRLRAVLAIHLRLTYDFRMPTGQGIQNSRWSWARIDYWDRAIQGPLFGEPRHFAWLYYWANTTWGIGARIAVQPDA